MTLRDLILKTLAKQGSVRTTDVAKSAGVSRAYAHRAIQELQSEGLIVLMGRARSARYVDARTSAVASARNDTQRFTRTLRNSGLDEDSILATIKRETGIFVGLPEPATRIVDYGFTEILNNAIEHSHSPSIQVTLARTPERVHFRIFDRGVGIFANLQESMHLESELDAVRQLLKGKQTTAPEAHTGEGIYFTSRSADLFSIQSGQTLLLFNNFLPDVFVRKLPRSLHGTSVNFTISANTERDIEKIFSEHTNEGYVFDKTTVRVKLYKLGSPYISRSQARRITSGLDRFALIILDFAEVDTVGQAFADEVFRVWQRQHPQVTIQVENANEAVNFMIRHAQTTET